MTLGEGGKGHDANVGWSVQNMARLLRVKSMIVDVTIFWCLCIINFVISMYM